MIVKNLKELTNEDFEMHPIWHYKKDNGLRTGLKITPFTDSEEDFKKKLEDASVLETFYVKSKFTTYNGRLFYGFCKITNHYKSFEISDFAPKIITKKRQINLWYGAITPSNNKLIDIYLDMVINPKDLFPLYVEIIPNIFHIENSGLVKGFVGLNNETKQYIIKVE